LRTNVQFFHTMLCHLGLPVPTSPSPIVPLRVASGEPRAAMTTCEALLERGIFAHGIRPPTVPPGTARIRFALSALHTHAHLQQAIDAISELRSHFAGALA